MYIITVKQAGLEFQYTQGQLRIPMTLANANIYWLPTCCFWTKTCKLICWYPSWNEGVISVQPLLTLCGRRNPQTNNCTSFGLLMGESTDHDFWVIVAHTLHSQSVTNIPVGQEFVPCTFCQLTNF